MSIFGIESSCDDTAIAVLDLNGGVLAHNVASQIDAHEAFGGVVPQIAARKHADVLGPLAQKTLKDANIKPSDITAVAATQGPGLIGSVMLGLVFGKMMAALLHKPFIAVNHLEGHALLPCLTNNVQPPYLLLLISGGHTQFFAVKGFGNYVLLGQSLDDALGETFDKVGRLLGLPYPGGPHIERVARAGNPDAFAFPKPMKGRPGCDFSFSGLKTSAALKVKALGAAVQDPSTKADFAASFQKTISDIVCERMINAVAFARQHIPHLKTFVLSGGVAANRAIFQRVQETASRCDLDVVAPPTSLCTDNGVMIAFAALKRYQSGAFSSLLEDARARWPLDEVNFLTSEQSPDATEPLLQSIDSLLRAV